MMSRAAISHKSALEFTFGLVSFAFMFILINIYLGTSNSPRSNLYN